MDIHEELKRKKTNPINPKLDGIVIPRSTSSELIMPCRLSYYGFILLKKDREYLHDIATERINETLGRLNKHIDLILIEKKQEESKDYQEGKLWAMRSLFILGIVISFIMYMLVLYEVKDFKEGYIFIPLGLLIAIILVSLIIMIQGLMTERVRVNVEKQIQGVVSKIIKQENESYYAGKGYLLEKNESLYWLSLKKVF